MVMPERLKPYAGRGQPHPCEVCRQRIKQKLGFEAGQVGYNPSSSSYISVLPVESSLHYQDVWIKECSSHLGAPCCMCAAPALQWPQDV